MPPITSPVQRVRQPAQVFRQPLRPAFVQLRRKIAHVCSGAERPTRTCEQRRPDVAGAARRYRLPQLGHHLRRQRVARLGAVQPDYGQRTLLLKLYPAIRGRHKSLRN